MANNMFKFVLVQSGKSAYTNLAVKDSNTMYAIPETKEIFFGEDLVASKNVFVSEAMPAEAGQSGMIYVVTGEAGKGIYFYDTADSQYKSVVSFADFVTASGTATITNKTIDADNNTITNLELDNMKAGVVQTTVRDAATAVDTAVVTEKAVRTELDSKVDKVPGKSLVDDTEIAKLATVAENANNYVHPTSGVAAGDYNKVTVDVNGHVTAATLETTLAGLGITDAYTKEEITQKFSELEAGLDWKEAVATFGDIATTYPNPEEGWTVSVKDTNIIYRYDDATSTWVNILQSVVDTIVVPSVDGVGGNNGLMTAAMAEKLNGIAAGAEVNQNAVSSIETDEGTVVADAKTDAITIKGGKDIKVSATGKDIVVASTYVHPESGVNEGTYNKVTVDKNGHVTAATAETTLKGLGVTGAADDITAMTGYTALVKAGDVDPDTVITAADTLNAAIAKLAYRADNMAAELADVLDGKVDKTSIATVLDDTCTDTQVASAKAVYDALCVVRI